MCSDYDLMYTLVGGCKALISTVVASDVLECLEVTRETRIGPFVPMPPGG